MELLTSLVGPALAAAAVSAVVSVWALSRNVKHKSVIEERQKWRDTLRELVPTFLASTRAKERMQLRNSIALRLNPHDEADKRKVELLDAFISQPSAKNERAIVEEFQKYLKLDWERAKIEASLRPWFAQERARRTVERQASGQKRWIDDLKYPVRALHSFFD